VNWLRWILIVVSAIVGSLALDILLNGDFLPGILVLACAVVAWPSVLVDPLSTCRTAAGKAYGVPYYLEWDGHQHYFSADVHGYHATTPHERDIREVIFRLLTQAVARRAVDKVIKRTK